MKAFGRLFEGCFALTVLREEVRALWARIPSQMEVFRNWGKMAWTIRCTCMGGMQSMNIAAKKIMQHHIGDERTQMLWRVVDPDGRDTQQVSSRIGNFRPHLRASRTSSTAAVARGVEVEPESCTRRYKPFLQRSTRAATCSECWATTQKSPRYS